MGWLCAPRRRHQAQPTHVDVTSDRGSDRGSIPRASTTKRPLDGAASRLGERGWQPVSIWRPAANRRIVAELWLWDRAGEKQPHSGRVRHRSLVAGGLGALIKRQHFRESIPQVVRLNDAVPSKHRFGFQAEYPHGDVTCHPRPGQTSRCGSSEIVEQLRAAVLTDDASASAVD